MVTIAEVAALISACVVLAQLSYPLLLSLVTVGSLKKRNNAATWSVLGRLINASLWPYILRTDTASRIKVDRRIQALSGISTFTRILLAVAATVTPLGLHNTIKSAAVDNVPFRYVKDTSPIGKATQLRDGYEMNRKCGGGMLATPCPGNDDGFTFVRNDTGEYLIPQPGREDAYLSTTIASNITDIFSRSTQPTKRTVAGVFDIQWRSFIKYNNQTDAANQIDQGRPRTEGRFRYFQQMLSENNTFAVEGLVVSMGKEPGIGFRNHTLPPSSDYGYNWSEDVLWMAPETSCVGLNLSFQYSIPPRDTSEVGDSWMLVNDQAFSNIPTQFPKFLYSSPGNPQLRERARQAATVTNKMVARWLNISTTDGQQRSIFALKGLIPDWQSPPEPRSMQFNSFGSYNFSSGNFRANLPGALMDVGKSSDNYSADTWMLNSDVKGYAGGDVMNISTIGLAGGLMLGLGNMMDENGDVSYDARTYSLNPGTTYSHPLMACVSAVKLSVRTARFRLNGTAMIPNLIIEGFEPTHYDSETDWPIWAMEKTSRNISEFNSFWGIVSKAAGAEPTLETVQMRDFYIPAGMTSWSSTTGIQFGSSDSVAGTDAPFRAFGEIYSVVKDDGPDYIGMNNWFLYTKWANLSRTAETTGKIIDHIWTDLMANGVMGSTSLLTSSDSSEAFMSATQYYAGLSYDWRYATPALLVAVLYSTFLSLTAFLLVTKRLNIEELRYILNQTAAGRALTTERYQASGKADIANTKEWAKTRGDELVIVGKNDECLSANNEKANNCTGSDDSGNQPFMSPATDRIAAEN